MTPQTITSSILVISSTYPIVFTVNVCSLLEKLIGLLPLRGRRVRIMPQSDKLINTKHVTPSSITYPPPKGNKILTLLFSSLILK